MLRAHQACIDLEKNVLRIQNREVGFLPEHELPEKARIMDSGADDPTSPDPSAGPSSSGTGPAVQNQPPRTSYFPGGGRTLASAPSAGVGRGALAMGPGRRPASAPLVGSGHSEEAIATLIGLGATREIAISTLDAAGGNLDVAASLLF